MSKLANIIYDSKNDFIDKLANDYPDFTDLLILVLHLPDSERQAILESLTSFIKNCFASRPYM